MSQNVMPIVLMMYGKFLAALVSSLPPKYVARLGVMGMYFSHPAQKYIDKMYAGLFDIFPMKLSERKIGNLVQICLFVLGEVRTTRVMLPWIKTNPQVVLQLCSKLIKYNDPRHSFSHLKLLVQGHVNAAPFQGKEEFTQQLVQVIGLRLLELHVMRSRSKSRVNWNIAMRGAWQGSHAENLLKTYVALFNDLNDPHIGPLIDQVRQVNDKLMTITPRLPQAQAASIADELAWLESYSRRHALASLSDQVRLHSDRPDKAVPLM